MPIGGTITSDWNLVYRSPSSQETHLPQGPIKSAMMGFTAATLLAGNDWSALNLISGLYGPRSLNPQFSSLVCQTTWPLLTNKHSRGRGLAHKSVTDICILKHILVHTLQTLSRLKLQHMQVPSYRPHSDAITGTCFVSLDLFDSMMKFGAHSQGYE
jgi:hypothetical protein